MSLIWSPVDSVAILFGADGRLYAVVVGDIGSSVPVRKTTEMNLHGTRWRSFTI